MTSYQTHSELEETAKKHLEAAGFKVSYFPMEGKYMAFKDSVSVSEFHNTLQDVFYEVFK